MQVELSKDQLERIVDQWYPIYDAESGICGPTEEDKTLVNQLTAKLDEARELDGVSFDECEGGACKL